MCDFTAGQRVDAAGTGLSDGSCDSCPEGKYATQTAPTECGSDVSCAAGQYLSNNMKHWHVRGSAPAARGEGEWGGR